MTGPAIHELDPTLQQANKWLRDVMQRLGTDDAHTGHTAMRVTLHALRDRIGPENAVHLGAQLPTLIRGIFYDGWHPSGTPTKERHKQDFLDHVRKELRTGTPIDPETAIGAVLEVVCEKTAEGEAVKLARLFPKNMRELWPNDVQAEADQQERKDRESA
jgi:uncharacterized protein (DUF2267 family)